jgi:hypothetical protein
MFKMSFLQARVSEALLMGAAVIGICYFLTGCDDPQYTPTAAPAVTECGDPPDAPHYAVAEEGSDSCMETVQFEGLQNWIAADADWRECVITAGRVRLGCPGAEPCEGPR